MVKGYDISVMAGVLASRERAALLVGSTNEQLAFDHLAALEESIPPVDILAEAMALC